MNQVNCLTVFGLLTVEQQAGFCGEAKKRGMYDTYNWGKIWEHSSTMLEFGDDRTYRLKILPDEWYYVQSFNNPGEVRIGSEITQPENDGIDIIRPARPEEIPHAIDKPPLGEVPLNIRIEKAYKDKQVDLLAYNESNGCLSVVGDDDQDAHVILQSLKGFAGYVYESKGIHDINNEFFISLRPMHGTPYDRPDSKGIILPLAVLFDKDLLVEQEADKPGFPDDGFNELGDKRTVV